MVKVAAAQISVTKNTLNNLNIIIKYIKKAALKKVDIVCFPETSLVHNKNKKTNFKSKTDEELYEIYDELIDLIMENGYFFAYSREDTVKPIKNKIIELIDDKDKLKAFQLLTTPTEEDIFLTELKDKIKQSSNLTDEEIDQKIKNKINENYPG